LKKKRISAGRKEGILLRKISIKKGGKRKSSWKKGDDSHREGREAGPEE